jgi:hypothetical protein
VLLEAQGKRQAVENMRQNFRADKRRKEELRKKKQEAKRNKRLNRSEHRVPPDQVDSPNPDQVVT